MSKLTDEIDGLIIEYKTAHYEHEPLLIVLKQVSEALKQSISPDVIVEIQKLPVCGFTGEPLVSKCDVLRILGESHE